MSTRAERFLDELGRWSHRVAGEDKCSDLNGVAVDENWLVTPARKGSEEVAREGLTVGADHAGLSHVALRVDGDENAGESLRRSKTGGGRLPLSNGPSWNDWANFPAGRCAVALLKAVRS